MIAGMKTVVPIESKNSASGLPFVTTFHVNCYFWFQLFLPSARLIGFCNTVYLGGVHGIIRDCGSACLFSFHMADPDPTFHFNADPDPDPTPRQNNTNLRPLVYRPSTAPRLQCERPRPSLAPFWYSKAPEF